MKRRHAIRVLERAWGLTETEIGLYFREKEAGPEGWFGTEAWRASWRARGATDEEIDGVIARVGAEVGGE